MELAKIVNLIKELMKQAKFAVQTLAMIQFKSFWRMELVQHAKTTLTQMMNLELA